MTASGIYTSGLTLNETAAESFDLLQIGADGETLGGDMIGRFKKSANMLLKEWQAQGIHLWTYTEGTLFPTVGQEKYDFRLAATHVANTWYETTSTAATVAGATVLPVTSATNLTVGDPIGVIQTDNNVFWTTIKSISSLNVTLTAGITLATLSGAFVRNYRVGTATSPELIPISRILNVRRLESSDYEVPIIFTSREDYFNLPNKESAGTPIQAHYSRQDVAGETSGIMYLWNSPSSSVPVINFTYERKIQVLVNATDTVDIPDYAQKAFIWNVAVDLIPKYGYSAQRAQFITSQAQILKDNMLAFDAAMYPIRVKPRLHG